MRSSARRGPSFLERGPTATSLEIARRAGVSEGTVFKRFKTKAELFRAALELDDEPPSLRDLPARVGSGGVEQNLLEASIATLEHLERAAPLFRLRLSRSNRLASRDALVSEWGSRGLSAYLDGEIGLGRLPRFDVQLVAVAFVGALFAPSLIVGGARLDRTLYARACVAMVRSAIHPA
ncbi:MAG: helix-turn-helix domain-containing protein [Polyangiaceae bacterium]